MEALVLGAPFAVGTSSGISSGRNRKQWKEIDRGMMETIYNYYQHQEGYITVCKRLKESMIFSGGVHMTWGSGLFRSAISDDPKDQRELVSLLKTALEYRDMFGFCPIKLVRDKTTGLTKPVIPQLVTGKFEITLDPRDNKTVLRFVQRDWIGTEGGFLTSVGGGSSKSYGIPVQLDEGGGKKGGGTKRNYQVFVWEEPTLTSSGEVMFKSRIPQLIPQWLNMREFWENAQDSDYASSHPPVFTQSKDKDFDPNKLTEEEIFGDNDLNGNPTLRERVTYRRDTFRSILTEKMTKHMNMLSKGQIPMGITGAARKEAQVSATHKNRRQRDWKDYVENLPIGEEMAGQVSTSSRNDLLEISKTYWDLVCLTMGVPREYVQGGSGGRFKTNVEQMREIIRQEVELDREDSEKFYQFVYEWMYRKDDSKKIATILTTLEGRREDLEEDKSYFTGETNVAIEEEIDRIDDTTNKLNSVGEMPTRIRLIFAEDSLMSALDNDSLIMADQMGALSSQEVINVWRSKMSLPKISETHPLVKEREKQKELQQKAEAAQLRNTILNPEGITTSTSTSTSSTPSRPSREKTPGDRGKNKKAKTSTE